MWLQIENTITEALLAKEDKILGIMQRYQNRGNFFEMVRFDFIVDSNLDAYLMEANMSPNLSSEHFPPNRVLYENVLYNMLALVGVGRRIRADTLSARCVENGNLESCNVALSNKTESFTAFIFGGYCRVNSSTSI